MTLQGTRARPTVTVDSTPAGPVAKARHRQTGGGGERESEGLVGRGEKSPEDGVGHTPSTTPKLEQPSSIWAVAGSASWSPFVGLSSLLACVRCVRAFFFTLQNGGPRRRGLKIGASGQRR